MFHCSFKCWAAPDIYLIQAAVTNRYDWKDFIPQPCIWRWKWSTSFHFQHKTGQIKRFMTLLTDFFGENRWLTKEMAKASRSCSSPGLGVEAAIL